MVFRLLLPKTLLSVSLAVTALIANAQSGFFEPASSAQQARTAAPVTDNIRQFSTYRLRTADMRSYLAKAPLEFAPNSTALRLDIPLPNGTVEPFAMLESPILAPAIAAQHPEIKTYTGRGQSHANYTIRLSFTSSGFDAIILGVNGDAVYYTKASANPTESLYRTYFARDVKAPDVVKPFGTQGNKCGTTGPAETVGPDNGRGARLNSAQNNTGTTLRTFRLAVAVTGEFTQRAPYSGNVTAAFNGLIGYVNRMNAVYRRELAVAFTLVTGENTVYADPATDPYTNTNQITMLAENQTNLDNATVLGSANYDVGHVLSFEGGSGGGIAASPSICSSSQKAQGVSGIGDGSFAPIFDDQLLSHEIGHQFGMSHSFNSSIPVCTTREAATSVEPGAGATIMSYGFTCSGMAGNDNYENTFQPFLNFHTANYQQAVNTINANSCFTSGALANAVPVIGTFPVNTTIPRSTPFELTGAATDADGQTLSYQWEGTNIGTETPTGTTLADRTKPPFFRSYTPVATGTRTFPRLAAILNGTNNAVGDKLPSVGIATTHRLTVRDDVGGLTNREVTVTIDGNSGPFLETTNLAGSYQGNSAQTITWSVNNTDQAPVNCANVSILLSTDGGMTFPTTLLANTPNDGTESVTLPNLTTSMARIKIVAVNNVFFDISNANFAIAEAVNQPPVAAVIGDQTGTLDAAFSFTVPAFTDPENQTLSYIATGLPASLTFDAATRVISGIPTTLGAATVTIVASDPASATASASFTITINSPAATPIVKVNSNDPSAAEGAPATQTTGSPQAKNSRAAANLPVEDSGFIRFERTNGTGTLVINYQVGGSATNGVDYDALPTSVTFAEGQTVLLSELDPIEDDIVEGDETIIITLIDEAGYDPDPNEITTTLTLKDNDSAPGSLTISSFVCNTTSAGLSSVNFVVGYAGGTFTPALPPLLIIGVTGNGQLGQSYTFAGFDANVNTLTVQDQASRSTYFTWDFRAACAVAPPQPPTPTGSLTITSFVCNTTSMGLSSVNFVVGYPGGTFTPAVAPLFINGVTGNGQLGQSYTFAGFDGNVSTLTVQDAASRSTYFTWNFRAACAVAPSQPPTPVSSLTITSFTCNAASAVSSVNFVVGYPGGTFTPAVAPLFINGVTGNGQLGQSYAFTGFDANVSTLSVQDAATRSTYFTWDFRAACASGARRGVEVAAPWQMSLLGNPATRDVTVLIDGAQGQALTIELLTTAGRTITSRQILPATTRHREVFDVAGQPAGLLLLRTRSDTRSQSIKVIKE